MRKNKVYILGLLISILLFGACTAQSQAVYKTPSGKKYHLATCHMVKNVSSKIFLAEANELGLTACLICKPASLSPQPFIKPVQGTSTTVKCSGLTKAGNRCRHRTSIANGYCYQHQPG
jgi:hypothetical protein